MINVTKSSMPPMDEYFDEIKDLWDTGWLTNNGEKYQEFEWKLNNYLDVEQTDLFVNGHQALELTLQAFDLSGEIITPPFTFASTTHAIVRNGLTPVFCDIDPVHFTLDANLIESLITENTSAILPVHVYGNICDVETIERIAKEYNLKVLYDAAHTFGVTVNGKGIGNFGDASMFSFHATKVFHSIEGGAITYNQDWLTPKLNSLKNFGLSSSGEVDDIGSNAKMNELQAAMGICNLRYIDQEIAKRKQVHDRYLEHLSGIEGIQLRESQTGVTNNYAYFPIVLHNYYYSRDELMERLEHKGIKTRKYFYPLTSQFSCYQGKLDPGQTPVAEFVSNNVLALPIYGELALEDVDLICHIILN